MAIVFNPADYEELRRHGQDTYPHECCGILLGTSQAEQRQVQGVVRMRNVNAATPENRFDFDPREHLRVQREARERGLEIIGFYHSHPDHPARPSQFDLDHASWPGYSYVIMSVAQGKTGAVNSFELAEDRSHFIQEELAVAGADL